MSDGPDTRPRWEDPELQDLFGDDPALATLAQTLAAARPEPSLDPRFRNVLRARLLEEGASVLHQRRRWWMPGMPQLALGSLGAAMAAVVIIAVVVDRGGLTGGGNAPGIASCNVCGQARLNPNDTIRVSFNEPMDHASVEAALRIKPAVDRTLVWDGNTLLITPTHHLSGNTAYTVTIDHTVARDAHGQAPAADLHVVFGTQPTPPAQPTPNPTAVAGPPALNPIATGTVSPGARLVFAPDGDLLASTAPRQAEATSTPGPEPTPTPTAASSSPSPTAQAQQASPSASPSASGSASPSPAAVPTQRGGGLTRLTGAGSPAALAGPVRGVAVSPDGRSIAYLDSERLVVAAADGSAAHPLAAVHGDNPAITWTSAGELHFVSDGAVQSIDPAGSQRTLTRTKVAAGAVVVFSGDGRWAYVAGLEGNGDGDVIDLRSGSRHPLEGSRDHVSFSPDGAIVAWVDGDPGYAKAAIAASSGGNWKYLDAGKITDVAVDPGATRIAVVRDGRIRIVTSDGGRVLAEYTAASGSIRGVLWSPLGQRLAWVEEGSADAQAMVATVPGSSGPAPRVLSGDAVNTVDQFAAAQVKGDADAVRRLAPGLEPTTLLPPGVTRSLVVRTSGGATSVTAQVRLVVDATDRQPVAMVADEVVTVVHQSTGGWLVTKVDLPTIHAQPSGPQVTRVVTSTVNGTITIQVSFDSDLDPLTISGAVSAQSSDGTRADASVQYDAGSRTATVVVPAVGGHGLTLQLSTALHDVSGQPLAQAYPIQIQG